MYLNCVLALYPICVLGLYPNCVLGLYPNCGIYVSLILPAGKPMIRASC
jgi:hypothetical protein